MTAVALGSGDDLGVELADFRAFARVCPDFTAIATFDGRVLFVNAAGRELVGMPAALPVAAARVADYLPPDALAVAFAEEVPAVMAGGTWTGLSAMRDWRGGPPIPVACTSFRISTGDAAGPARFATIRRDLRAQIAADETVQAARRRLESEEMRHRALLEHVGDAVLVVRPDGIVAYASASITRILKRAPLEVVGASVAGLVDPRNEAALLAALRAQRAAGDVGALEVDLRTSDGRPVPVEALLSALGDVGGGATIVAIRDLSRRRLEERAGAALSAALERIASGAPLVDSLDALATSVEAQLPGTRCSILLVEGEGADRRLRSISAPSLPPAYHQALDASPLTWSATPCARAALTGRPYLVGDVQGDPAWRHWLRLATELGIRLCWSFPITSPRTGEVIGTFAIYSAEAGFADPIAEPVIMRASHVVGIAVDRAAQERRLLHAATHDPLTGLPNRSLLLERLDEALGGTEAEEPVAVFLDLDRLKVINDSLGHDAGDEVLREVARRLRANVRAPGTVARFGGDEFVVVACPTEGGEALATRCLDAISAPITLGSRTVTCSASAGVTKLRGHRSAADALRDADLAMYRAKAAGGRRATVADPAMHHQALERLDLEAALRAAVAADELVLAYQPIVDITDGTATGVEVLLRWSHPTRGPISPATFIPIAEEVGLIDELGLWVLERASAAVAGWVAAGAPPGTLAVNLSGQQLQDARLQPAVAAAAAAIWPWSLQLELTEGELLRDLQAIRALVGVPGSDVTLAIDDFGTGYSSLSYLTQLPVHTLKIDRSFVASIGSGADDAPIVTAIVGLGRSLRLDVIAEGVETDHQLEVLHRVGCRLAQGFRLHRPLPEGEAAAVLGAGEGTGPLSRSS